MRTFKIEKAIQAAAVLLRRHQGRMEYTRLLKLLYVAERKSLQEHGNLLVDDRLVAMAKGPLHSLVYDLIKGIRPEHNQWAEFIQTDGYDSVLRLDPGVGALSEYEVDLLESVDRIHSEMDTWEVVELTHGFAEWQKNFTAGTSSPIPIEDLFDDPDEARAVAQDIREDRLMAELLS